MGFNSGFKGLNVELNLVCHLLALLGAHPILHVSGIRVKQCMMAFSLYHCQYVPIKAMFKFCSYRHWVRVEPSFSTFLIYDFSRPTLQFLNLTLPLYYVSLLPYDLSPHGATTPSRTGPPHHKGFTIILKTHHTR
jgi:hypothetical protein